MADLNLFRNLLSKDIYAILDGDKTFGTYESDGGDTVDIGLPYLTGPNLCDISTKFGKPVTYGSISRWYYVEDLLKHCIETNTCSSILKYLFSRPQFNEYKKTPYGLSLNESESLYKKSVNAAIDEINKELGFTGSKLVYQDKKFEVVKSTHHIATDDEMFEDIFKEERHWCRGWLQEYFNSLSTECLIITGLSAKIPEAI